MITVICQSEPERSVFTLRIRGHANYAPGGYDIVCAGVSTLGYTFAAVVRRLEAEGALVDRPLIHEAEGELRIRAQAREAHRGALAQSFDTVRTGLALLAENYPEHVRMR